MNLKDFENKIKKTNKKTILNNNEINISQENEKTTIIIKNISALEKYEDQLFFAPTKAIITDSNKKAKEFFKLSILEGTEGLMFKNLNSQYRAGLRVGNMIKLKETKDDLDLVIVAAEHGKGKRAGFYSSFYVAVYDSQNEDFLTVGKVSSGIKELDNSQEGISLNEIRNLLKPLKIKEKENIVYFEPKIVIQVRFQEIQKSTKYNSGYALRFPRIIMLREDKSVEEISTIEDIVSNLNKNK